MSKANCVFCRIAAGEDPTTTLLYEDDTLVVFKDIKPATDNHFLVITKRHIKHVKKLKKSDIEMVENMKAIGENMLTKAGQACDKMRFGFHWPPYNTVDHLHCHALAPFSKCSYKSRMEFKPGSYWFGTVEEVIEWLSKQE